jgi:membrane protease YdiL (CAAX protease family)
MKSAGMRQADTKGRWHPVVRVLLYFLALAVVNRFAFAGVVGLLPSIPGWLLDLLEGSVYLAGVLALTWAFCRYLDRQALASLGLQRQGWIRYLAVGLSLGTGLMALLFIAMLVAGRLTTELAWPGALPLFGSVLSWAALSFVEELTFRGYIMQGLAKAWAMSVAVGVSSILFGMVHIIDPNAQFLGILNICDQPIAARKLGILQDEHKETECQRKHRESKRSEQGHFGSARFEHFHPDRLSKVVHSAFPPSMPTSLRK